MLKLSQPVTARLACACVVICVCLTGPRSASAQTTDVIGVRAQGMAGAFTAVADDATAWWWNPAGLSGGPFFNALLEFGRPDTSVSTSVRGFSVAYPALGFTYYRLPLRQIRLSASTESSATNRQDDEAALRVYGATVGQSFGNHLVLGSTLKLLHADDTNVGLDVGVMTTFGPVRVGVTVRDLTQPSFGSGATAFTLDRTARAGVALSSGRRGVIGSATLAFDADLQTTHDPAFGDERRIAVGAEAWSQGNRVGLRGGISSNRAADQGTQVSGGLSFSIRSGSFVDAYVSGGGEDVRHGWGLDLRVTF
jgi:F plasmid transfer operon, TraF, protein